MEIQLAQTLAAGKPVTGVTWDVVHEMNAGHAKEHDAVTKEAALDLLRRNSAAAAAAIRALSDEELDRAHSLSPSPLVRFCSITRAASFPLAVCGGLAAVGLPAELLYPTRRSRASSCSRITPSGTAIITWPACARR